MLNLTSAVRYYDKPGEPAVVAVIFDDDGTVYDHAWSWETGQNFAMHGNRVVAVRNDGYMTISAMQALFDSDRDRYRDCYGIA